MARHQKHVSLTEVEALWRRYDWVRSEGGTVPDTFVEKYGRLERIAGDGSFGAEASQLAADLFVLLEASVRGMPQQTQPKKDGQVNVKLEPQMLAALDNFVAKRVGVNSRPQAISMILHDALKEHGLLPGEKQHSR